MTSLRLEPRLLAPRPRLLCGRLALGLCVPVLMLAMAAPSARVPAFGMFGAVFIAAQLALAIATAHKEILASSPSFFRAGLRRQLFAAQLVWAAFAVAAAVVGLHLAYPALRPAWLASTGGAALAVFALSSLATLRLSWSFQLPLWLFYAYFLMPLFMREVQYGHLDAALGATWVWLAGGVVLLWQLGRAMTSRATHRRLTGSLVLGVDDLLRPGRLQQFKGACAAGGRTGAGPRWRQRLIGLLVSRAAAASARGSVPATRVWQSLAVNAAASLSPRPWVVPLTAIGMLAMTVLLGYNDGQQGGESHWFAGLVYQLALFPAYGLGTGLLATIRPDCSRRTGYRAELRTVLGVTVLVCGLALLIAGAFVVLGAVLPPLTRGGETVVFRTARPHGIWLMPMLVPFAWLAVALKPRPQSPLPAFLLGTLFMAGHLALSRLPYHVATPYCAAASLAAFAATAALRRRWWRRTDLAS